jgi:chromosomal replication initiation ATPase DnaA
MVAYSNGSPVSLSITFPVISAVLAGAADTFNDNSIANASANIDNNFLIIDSFSICKNKKNIKITIFFLAAALKAIMCVKGIKGINAAAFGVKMQKILSQKRKISSQQS